MFGGFARAQENHGDIVIVARAKVRVLVDVDFGEARAEFLQQGSDLGFCFLAQVASGAGIEGDVARGGELQAAIFGARVGVRSCRGAQPSSLTSNAIAPWIPADSPISAMDNVRAPERSKADRIFISSESIIYSSGFQ